MSFLSKEKNTMNLDEVIFCYNKQYFTAHDVTADGNCYYRAVCLSPVIPITDHRTLCDALCTGLQNIQKYPFSEECQLVTSYYSHCEEAKKYSIESFMKYWMCHDGTWASTLEMMLTELVFDVSVAILHYANGQNISISTF